MDVGTGAVVTARSAPAVTRATARTALMLLLFVAPTIEYRMELGLFSMALIEPAALLGAAGLWWLWWRDPARPAGLGLPADPLARFSLAGAAAMVAWSIMLGLAVADWRSWLADVRNWLIPALVFGTLLITVRDGWRSWTLMIVVIGAGQSALAIVQSLTNGFRPFAVPQAFYKAGFTFDPATNQPLRASFGVGFFSHPNSLAIYLVFGLLLGLGWWLHGSRRGLKTAVVLVLVLGLATTYAKTSMAVALASIGAALLHQRIRSNRRLLAAVGAALAGIVAAGWLVAWLKPNLWLVGFQWRLALWGEALALLGDHPVLLVVGNALDDYAQIATYPQPHNLALYMMLAYGLIGLGWIVLTFWRLHREAWRLRGAGGLRRQPLLAMLWIGMWAFVAASMLEAPFVSIEWRTIWLLVAACFVGLRRETLEARDAA